MPFLVSLLAIALQSPTVTVSFPPTPIGKALSLLSKAAGKNLEVSGALKDEIMVANLRDAPTDEVLGNIAAVFLAKWDTRREGTRYLVPDPAARKLLEADEAKKELEALRPTFDYIAKQLAGQPAEMDDEAVRIYKAKLQAAEASAKGAEAAGDDQHARVPSALQNQAPSWRALARIVQLIGPDAMVRMEDASAVVYAEKPTRMQQSLPGGADEVLATYRRELARVDPTMNIVKAKVAVNRWIDGSFYFATFSALDATGKRVDFARQRINYSGDRYNRSSGEDAKPLPDEKPLDISEECLAARISLSRETEKLNHRKILREWRPRLEDPVHQEPTTWYQAADVLTVSKTLGRNMIGSVADITTGNFWEPDQESPSQYLAKNSDDFLPSKGGWLLYRGDPHVTRVSRSEGRALIRRSLDRGGLTVDDAAAQAAKDNDKWPFYNWLGSYLGALFPGRGLYSISGTTDSAPLRMWTSLGDSARTRLRSGATVPLTDLPPDAIRRISNWITYDAMNDPDPTEIMPDGITGGTVTLTTTEIPVVIGWKAKDGPPDLPEPLDAQRLGKYLASSYPGFADYHNWDTYRIGVSRRYMMLFTAQPGSYPMQLQMSETLFDPAKATVDRMPDDFQKQVEQARATEAAKPVQPPDKGVIPPH